MIAGVADTHTALWYLLKNPRLSATARQFMDDAAAAGHDIGLSPISLAEIVYLVEKNRLPASAYHELKNALAERGLRDRGSALHSGDRGRHAPGSARRCSGHAGQDCGGDRRVSRSAGHQLRRAHSQFQRSHGLVISDRPIRAVFTARRPMLCRPRTPRLDRRQLPLCSVIATRPETPSLACRSVLRSRFR